MTQTPQETLPKEAMTEKEYAELHPDDGEVFELVGFTQQELIDQVVGLGGGTCTEAETADQVLAIREGKYDI
jgi:alcohol dehydrogenase class IV